MNREALLAAMAVTAKPKVIAVDVEAWGKLHVRPPTVDEVDEAHQAMTEDESGELKKHGFARAAARLLCDEDGTRIFDPTSAEDIALLASQPWSMLQKILNAADPEKAMTSGN